ncbi:adenosylcobinamide-phosphate synthase CbiB [Hahella sp. CR1]|uniref:adenosylcobinamide-phosphate synthase CbiB n=1 Tax=Hahella sp. CR1 TaxID=2992807 RepID=UPI0024420ACB|nr:adenosylcobinamide-phosphate synthase CbiB [Hahella sp. CR1]MDG9667000.1 adenosylcobinamide-phosphate synthase CbiB [Hahella sp. CR1]
MDTLLILVLALSFDALLGEPRRLHPLVGFGRYAGWVEGAIRIADFSSTATRALGAAAVTASILPWAALAWLANEWSESSRWGHIIFSAFVLYLAIGWRSLLEHVRQVAAPLRRHDAAAARRSLSMIVSRDTAELGEEEIASAATESALENGNDAIFAAIFWFLLAGVPGVVMYRLSNTLDAMWGYKNTRYFYFGWAAARLDDLLNWVPARLTAFSYACCGALDSALRCWRAQGGHWKSPNAGPVMAAGAGALRVRLGGAATYHGSLQYRPSLGCGDAATAQSIERACGLINRSLALWTAMVALGAGALWLWGVV